MISKLRYNKLFLNSRNCLKSYKAFSESKKTMNLVGIGYGTFGKYMRNEIFSKNLTNEFNFQTAYKREFDAEKHLMNKPDLDAVYVTTPDKMHSVNSIMALNAGKPVFSEKPIYDLENVLEQSQNLKVNFWVGYMRRYHKDWLDMKAYLQT